MHDATNSAERSTALSDGEIDDMYGRFSDSTTRNQALSDITPRSRIAMYPGFRRGASTMIVIVVVLVIVAALLLLWWSIGAGSAKRELATKQALADMHVLAVMDAAGTHVASVNLSTLAEGESLDRAVELVADLPQLNSLDASRTQFGDQHAALVSDIKSLNTVTLIETKVTDAGVAELAKLPNLESLNLALTAVTDAGVEPLGNATSLKVLDLSGTKVASDFSPLAQLPNLTWLALRNTTLEDGALDSLAESPSLQQLSLESAVVSDAAIDRLKSKLPQLRVQTGTLASPNETSEPGEADDSSQSASDEPETDSSDTQDEPPTSEADQ